MQEAILEDILACPSLPSLPAVATRVIELTSDPDVRMSDLAATVESDQGLAAKILRTVNSSFFGLRERCSTVERALVLLGLRPVKALALGFSLVSTVGQEEGATFDYVAYWRRALYSAVGARAVALAAGLEEPDEAFLAALFQDVGMIAMHRALGDSYLRVIDRADGVHGRLVGLELAEYETQHPDIGAMLASRWRLPPELTIPIKYHERPTAAPVRHAKIVRAVALGNIVHDLFSTGETVALRARFYGKAAAWFHMLADDAEQVLRDIGESVGEVSRLFGLDTGDAPSAQDVQRLADQRLLELAAEEPQETYAARRLEELLIDVGTDPLTGALRREGFDQALETAFSAAAAGNGPLTVLELTVEGLDRALAEGGQTAHDAAVLAVSAMLNKHMDPVGGIVCRLDDALFAVVVPGSARQDALVIADELCGDLARVLGVRAPGVSVSVGLASADESTTGVYRTPCQLVVAAGRAAAVARSSGSNCVRAFIPRRAA